MKKTLYFLLYTDEGPLGLCAQSCYITSSWTKLFVFDDYYKMTDFAQKPIKGRKKPKFKIINDICWLDKYLEQSTDGVGILL